MPDRPLSHEGAEWCRETGVRTRVLAVVGVLLTGGLTMPYVVRQDRVYTVPQVVGGLAHDPQAWVGRTVLVRGTAVRLLPTCLRGRWCPTVLATSRLLPARAVLLLEPGPTDPLVTRLRGLPLVNGVVPQPQRLRWDTPATYRLAFQVVPGTTCDRLPCVTVLLADAAPQAQ